MSKTKFICFLLFFHCNVYAQKSNAIVIGKIDTLNSKILNEQRKIWIYVPDAYSDEIYENKNYPVIYLLDGSTNFYSVVGIIQQLSSVNSVVPKMIVVGIPNTNRTRDLTPTKVMKPEPFFVDDDMVADSGGGNKFISFIEKELIPYIDSNYPTDPYRMFIRHSLGGLTVLNTLINKPELFNSYVAIDPSIWWDNKKLLNKIKQTPLNKKYINKTLFLGIANTMSEGMDISSVQKDTTISTKHIRSILELNDLLNKNEKQLKFKGKYYEEDDHGSVPLIAEYDALRYIFDFYQMKIDMQDYMNPESDILSIVRNHYIRLSKEFRRKIKPEEKIVNDLGYGFMNMQQFKKAEDLFKLNVTNYPTNFNVYDSLGDLYVAIKEKKRAIENYKKAISLNKKSEISKKKLNALEKEQ